MGKLNNVAPALTSGGSRPGDGVDLGLWRRVDPGALVIPLDLHVGRSRGSSGSGTGERPTGNRPKK